MFGIDLKGEKNVWAKCEMTKYNWAKLDRTKVYLGKSRLAQKLSAAATGYFDKL